MNPAVACEDASIMNHAGGISLILKSAGPAGEALDQALRAAGFRVRVAPTVFDVVTEAQRTEGLLQHLFVGVDQWGPGEFRLLPLVRREWPATTIVAYCSPGFAYKGRVAELVGADAVLTSIGEILHFIEGLAPLAEPAPSLEPPPEPAPVAQAPAARPVESPAPVAAAASATAAPAVAAPPEVASVAEPPPPAPDTTRPPASPVQSIPLMRPQYAGSDVDDAADDDGIDGEVIGTIELTDEELRLLLGEDEEV
jgi:hypothetical protein